MKKVFLTFAVFMAALSAFSENITVQTAQQAAQSFLNSKMEGNQQIHVIDFAEKAEFPNFYVFGNEHCFVIISADDGAKPVIGYSTESGFGTDSLPDEIRDWLKANNDEISSAMNLRVEASPRIRSEWENLLSGRGLEPRSLSAVSPLITTHWHQYAPYNNLCPADPNASTGHAKAGCGAIAMAQFMNYWEHPVNGVGEHSYTPSNHPEYGVQYVNFGETVYDWANMKDDYSNGYNDAEALAVATLVYHCGVSVNMNYGPSGSACNSSVIDDALMTYFDYSLNTEYVFKETSTNTIPDETWIAMLKFNLDMEWPLIYRGETEFGEVGHIFICDGYDANDYFHINWGHGNGGGYGGYDGYFAIGSLYENWTNYSYNNAAIYYSIPNYLYNAYNGNDPLIYSFDFDSESISLKVNGHVDGEAATGTLIIPETKTFNGVTFPVTTIDKRAFFDCNGFTGDLVIPNSVNSIGDYAFYECSGFDGSLTVGNSVTIIGKRAFEGCYGFSEVLYNATNCADVIDIGYSPFSGCGGSLTIGDNVERIPDYMFSHAGFTGNLTIPNLVTTIGASSFNGCDGFTGDLVIPNSVATIGDHAFTWCTGFNGNLIIPDSVTTIGEGAFYHCSGFSGDLVIPNSVTAIGDEVFIGCSGFTGDLIIGNSVTAIGYRAFYGCSGFTGNLIIGNSVTEIGRNSFEYCSGFTGSLTIGNSVTTIESEAFRSCGGFISIQTLAENAPTLGYMVFTLNDPNIPVIVPCGSLASYQNASGWNNFTNIQEDCTSISEEYGDEVLVFPNPANDLLTVEGDDIQRVMVYNVSGQMIEDKEVEGQDVVQIDVKNYATGIFVVQILVDNGVVVKRFVKN